MYRPRPLRPAALLALSALLTGGCPSVSIDLPGGSLTLPGFNVVTLELINDTHFPVDPNIRFDDDSGFFAALLPSEDLGVHSLAPGEVWRLSFDCDELGLVRSDGAGQFVGGSIYVALPSRTLERHDDYDCGDLIQFQFLGDADAFDVLVAVNGAVVD